MCDWCQGRCSGAKDCPVVKEKFEAMLPMIQSALEAAHGERAYEVLGYSWDVWLRVVENHGIYYFDDKERVMTSYFVSALNRLDRHTNGHGHIPSVLEDVEDECYLMEFPEQLHLLSTIQRAFVVLRVAGFTNDELVSIGIANNRMGLSRIASEIKKNKNVLLQIGAENTL